MNNPLKTKQLELISHILVWLVLLLLPYTFTVGAGRPWADLFLFFWFQIALWAIIFYVNYLYCVNRWLFSNKTLLFSIANVALVFILIWLRYEIITHILPQNITKGRTDNEPPFLSRLYIDFFIYLLPVAFAIAIQSGKRLVMLNVVRQEADNIKLQSELQYLKYQLQPHFFFNSLNNIYALVDAEPEKAKHTIHSLSKLMRHLLQNSEAESVFLSDEISFLNKYIDLMAIRQQDNVKIEVHFQQHIPEIEIAPLLFVSLVENAFKHGVSATKPSWLYFELKIEGNHLIFITKNYNFSKTEKDMSGSGIGVENLKKRLALLYENRHTLTIKNNSDLYQTTLSIAI